MVSPLSMEKPDRKAPSTRATALWLLGIVLLGGVLRLYQVTAPPDDFLSWRDTQGLMIARNFFQGDMNLFRPEVDWRNTRDPAEGGVVGITELMITPWLTAWLYHLVGVEYWAGRVVPILFSLLGIVFFHRLVARFQGETQAHVASLLLTVLPYYLYCGRCQMPEAVAFCMVFAALYWYDGWLSLGGVWRFALAASAAVLMLLAKPQMGVHIVPMAYLTFARFGWRTPITGSLYAFALWVAVPFVAYSWWSNVVLLEVSNLSFAGPVFFQYERILTDPAYYERIVRTVFFQSVTPAVCLLAALGLFFRPYGKRGFFAHAWLLGALLLFVVFAGGAKDNGYYQLILGPPCALLAARVLGPCFTRRRLRPLAGLAAVGTVAYALSMAALLFQPNHANERRCGEWMRENLPEDALVLTESPSPATLYFADRKGWSSWQEYHGKRADFGLELIERLIPLGAQAVAITDPGFDSAYVPTFNTIRDVLYDSYACHKGDGFTVFLLDQPADLSVAGRVLFGLAPSRKYLRGSWGPDQEDEDGTPFTTLGPARTAGIRLTTVRSAERIYLDVASPVADQTLTVRVNGQWLRTVTLAIPGERTEIEVGEIPPRDASGGYTITLEVELQNRSLVGIKVYSIVAVDEGAPSPLLRVGPRPGEV